MRAATLPTTTADAPALTRLLSAVGAELPAARRLRRRLHAIPERGHAEHRTQEAVAAALGGPTATIAGTGLLARHGDGPDGIVVRAELDGLPVIERTGASFASTNGLMHACGHDVHAAALVALLRAARTLPELPAPLLGLFQPSEEAHPPGSRACLADGALDDVRAVVAAHVHPDIPWGDVALDPGAVNASADTLTIAINGRETHAAYPHEGRDPVLAIAHVIVGLHGLVGRRIDPLHPSVLTVGAVHAGEAENVIPGRAEARVTVRAHRAEDRDALIAAATRLCEHTAAAHGCRGRVTVLHREPELRNDPAIVAGTRRLLAAADDVRPGAPWRSCGADDFATYATAAPIAMAFVGLDGAPGFVRRPLHHPELLPPDEAVDRVAQTLACLYFAAAQPTAQRSDGPAAVDRAAPSSLRPFGPERPSFPLSAPEETHR